MLKSLTISDIFASSNARQISIPSDTVIQIFPHGRLVQDTFLTVSSRLLDLDNPMSMSAPLSSPPSNISYGIKNFSDWPSQFPANLKLKKSLRT